MKNKQVDINDTEQRVLEMALEFYIRLGLGQFSQIAQRLNLLCGRRLGKAKLEQITKMMNKLEEIVWDGQPWMLRDDETSVYTVMGACVEGKMNSDTKFVEWAEARIKEHEAAGDKVQ